MKVKGFQPLQLTWGPFVVDALSRGGKKNGNAGDTAGTMVNDAVTFLRKRCNEKVAVIVPPCVRIVVASPERPMGSWRGRTVGGEEKSMDHAAALIRNICWTEGIEPGTLVLHSNNGGPMKGSTMLATLEKFFGTEYTRNLLAETKNNGAIFPILATQAPSADSLLRLCFGSFSERIHEPGSCPCS